MKQTLQRGSITRFVVCVNYFRILKVQLLINKITPEQQEDIVKCFLNKFAKLIVSGLRVVLGRYGVKSRYRHFKTRRELKKGTGPS